MPTFAATATAGIIEGGYIINNREKILVVVAGGVAIIFVASLIVMKMFIAPARALDTRIVAVKSKIVNAEGILAKRGVYDQQLERVASRSFAKTPRGTSESLRARLVSLVGKAGLNEQAIQLTPENGRRIPKVMQSVGWSVAVKGSLKSIVRFLYRVEHQARIHRVEDLILTPVPRSQRVALRFKCMTLVLDSSKGIKLAPPRPDDDLRAKRWSKSVRAGYLRAVARDIFLPAIIRRPRQVRHTTSAPGHVTVRVLGLPHWGGRSEILVQRSNKSSTDVYHVGDTLGGGRIIGVDYRPMPQPDNPKLISESRVLICIKNQTWAVELGDTLAEKHRVGRAHLPASLARGNEKTRARNLDH